MSDDVRALSSLIESAEKAADAKRPRNAQTATRVATLGDDPSPSEQEEKQKQKEKENQIWDEKDVPDATFHLTQHAFTRPEYADLYGQSVSANHVYLGLGEATPGSASCGVMVIKVKLPGEKASDIDLDVQKEMLTVQGAEHRLATYLPQPVDPASGAAKWLVDESTLVVRVKILIN